MPSKRALGHALCVALARVLTSLACYASGFRAISDDDYSRVVIAAHFAHHPSLDPSGTSWLPLPFWLYGVPMALFGDALTTARGVAVTLGALAAVGVWVAARWLGLSERGALGAALGAVVLPYGAWLSAATVPEAPTAALLLLGAVSLVRSEGKIRALGGVALGAACFCRYESWAPALVFGVITAADAWRARRRDLWFAAAFALLPIALWLLHGVVRHGDALFFVVRVRQYRAALGGAAPSFGAALLQTPLALVRFEPELFAVTLIALFMSFRGRQSPFTSAAWRPVAALGALVLLLIAADASGGSATHHPERSLLPVFWFLTLVAAGLLLKLAGRLGRGPLVVALLLPLCLLLLLPIRPDVRKTFVDRREEELVGRVLRRVGATQVALDTDDFGFFAVQAALGDGRSFALADHDPRKKQPPRPGSRAELAKVLERSGARWLVTTQQREALAAPLGSPRIATDRFAVFALDRARLSASSREPSPAPDRP